MHAIFREASISYKIEANAWTDSYRQTLKDPFMCVYSIARLPGRENLLYWVGKISTATSSFYGLTRREIKINSLDDARQYKVAAIKDDASHHFLLENGFKEGANIYTHYNYDTLLHLLDIQSRGIDLVILSKEAMPYRLTDDQNPKDYKELMRIRTLDLHFHLACNKNTPEGILTMLTDSMAKLEREGTLERIRLKWSYPSRR